MSFVGAPDHPLGLFSLPSLGCSLSVLFVFLLISTAESEILVQLEKQKALMVES